MYVAKNWFYQRNVRNIRSNFFHSFVDKPKFIELNESTFYGTEGDNLIVSLQAYGHPQTMTYTWRKNGRSLSHSDKSTLNFTKLSRNDEGEYSCEAYNGEGSATLNFSISVRCEYIDYRLCPRFVRVNFTKCITFLFSDPASVKSISEVVMVNENEDAELWCTVEANPLKTEYVTWRRPGFAFESRTMSSFRNNTFYLVIRGVMKKDMGQFTCLADNGLGNETSQAAYLVVRREYC